MQERKIKCPQCGRFTFYSQENKFRPFCSERCKLIDLGAWADENYKVPLEDYSELNLDEFTDEFSAGISPLGTEPVEDN